jgi:beta-phosphoglucomutase
MQWIHKYQLFLFDFDGLLVNTEEMHYRAYQQMCFNRGIVLPWDFNRYCQAAHYEADALRHQLYAEFPQLYAREPDWQILYAEKKRALRALVLQGSVQLMPGVQPLLEALEKAQIQSAVVTHSPEDLVSLIRMQNPVLNTIPHWITREHYSKPKPDSECYVKAINLLAKPEDQIIGFEDTPRGLRALLGTRAKAVLVCQAGYPEIPDFLNIGASHLQCLEEAGTRL